jgi:chloramphenicol 3-O-phosphotransferase
MQKSPGNGAFFVGGRCRLEIGQIIVANGAPRSGKSSIVQVIQETFDGVWMNLGVDTFMQNTPSELRPGIGLRSGGERSDLEIHVPRFYAALYESIAAHSRSGLNVVADVGHHDAYSKPLGILADCARRLAGLPVLGMFPVRRPTAAAKSRAAMAIACSRRWRRYASTKMRRKARPAAAFANGPDVATEFSTILNTQTHPGTARYHGVV